MLQKTSTRFLLYEGTRIGEIQKSSNGNLSYWAWIPGEDNITDCVTRSLNPNQMDEKSGEKVCLMTNCGQGNDFPIPVEKYHDILFLKLVTARVLGIVAAKSFKGGATSSLSTELFQKAEKVLVCIAQEEFIDNKDQNIKQNFKVLNAKLNEDGLLVVGSKGCHNIILNILCS